MDQPGKVANPARGQLNREKIIFPCPRTRLRIWSRETGSVVPSRVSLLFLHTQAESGALYVCIYQPGQVANPARDQLNMSPFAPENLVSRDKFGRPVPRQPAHLHTQPESGAYLRDSSRFPRRRPFIFLYRHTSSGQSRVYRVTQFRTGGVHCGESPGTGPVNLKVVQNGCCLGRSPWTN